MDEPRKEKSPSGGGAPIMALLVIVLLMPLLYVLSIGPAALYYHTHGEEPEWLAYLYYPLGMLVEWVEPLQPILEWYLELWIGEDV